MFEKIRIFPFVHICIWTFMDSYSILEKIEKIVQFMYIGTRQKQPKLGRECKLKNAFRHPFLDIAPLGALSKREF